MFHVALPQYRAHMLNLTTASCIAIDVVKVNLITKRIWTGIGLFHLFL